MQSAEKLLRNDLRGELRAFLLNCELAMQDWQLPSSVAERLHAMQGLAEEMRGKFGVDSPGAAAADRNTPPPRRLGTAAGTN
jgi:hypothetical protein